MRIEYQNVDIAQEEHVILKGVNFQAEAGEFVYLIGKVGTGKKFPAEDVLWRTGCAYGKCACARSRNDQNQTQAHPGTTQTAGYRISGFPVAQRPYRTGQSGFRTQSDRMEKEEGTEHAHS